MYVEVEFYFFFYYFLSHLFISSRLNLYQTIDWIEIEIKIIFNLIFHFKNQNFLC
jgi:hypothetical protein